MHRDNRCDASGFLIFGRFAFILSHRGTETQGWQQPCGVYDDAKNTWQKSVSSCGPSRKNGGAKIKENKGDDAKEQTFQRKISELTGSDKRFYAVKTVRWSTQTTEMAGSNNWDDRHNTLFWQGDKGADKHNCLCVNCLRKVPLNSWKSGRQTTCSERTLSQSSLFVRKGNKQINVYLTFQSSSPLWSEVQGRRQWGL